MSIFRATPIRFVVGLVTERTAPKAENSGKPLLIRAELRAIAQPFAARLDANLADPRNPYDTTWLIMSQWFHRYIRTIFSAIRI